MFRVDGNYYAYDNNRWYTSRYDRGEYVMIDDSAVPNELTRVPREHWRSYPQRWTAVNSSPQYSTPARTTASLRISFGSTPRWSSVNGTRVEEIIGNNRPNHDMFRVDGSYYAYDNNRWYTSRYDRGDYTMINDSDVPEELVRVPRDHWRNYPQSWAARNDRPDYREPAYRAPATLQVAYGRNARWWTIRGTRVAELRGAARLDYDVFRYGGVFYAYNDAQWYRGRTGRGQYRAIAQRNVPYELSRVPRGNWRDYPASWVEQQRDPRYVNRGDGR
jgi:hypothetical protein